jgi:hypothetical protein
LPLHSPGHDQHADYDDDDPDLVLSLHVLLHARWSHELSIFAKPTASARAVQQSKEAMADKSKQQLVHSKRDIATKALP